MLTHFNPDFVTAATLYCFGILPLGLIGLQLTIDMLFDVFVPVREED